MKRPYFAEFFQSLVELGQKVDFKIGVYSPGNLHYILESEVESLSYNLLHQECLDSEGRKDTAKIKEVLGLHHSS